METMRLKPLDILYVKEGTGDDMRYMQAEKYAANCVENHASGYNCTVGSLACPFTGESWFSKCIDVRIEHWRGLLEVVL